MVPRTLYLTSTICKKFLRSALTNVRAMSSAQEDVIFETVNNVGVVTLNRPKALNAVNLSMVSKILRTLQEWESEKGVVLVKGVGDKAFCSGGDVRAIVEAGRRGERLGHDFFKTEYTMNGIIGNYQIPYVAVIDGIVMGGGVGLSVHGHYRICTERSLFAMPETQIGLFPDVGGSYFLPRLEGQLGYYLALTGVRVKGADIQKSGIATHFIESKYLKTLEAALYNCNDHQSIKSTLDKFCIKDSNDYSLKPYLEKIDKCFSGETMEEIIERLREDNSEWAQQTIKTLSNMSPTSLKVTLKVLQLGSGMNLLDCLQMEYRLAVACLNNHDFYEGVRALLIDKDKKPLWKPPSLSEVTDQLVDSHFSKLPDHEELRHKL